MLRQERKGKSVPGMKYKTDQINFQIQNEGSQRIKIKEEVKIFLQERVKKIKQKILLKNSKWDGI